MTTQTSGTIAGWVARTCLLLAGAWALPLQAQTWVHEAAALANTSAGPSDARTETAPLPGLLQTPSARLGLAPPAPAALASTPQAMQWLEGVSVYTYSTNCAIGNVEMLTGHYVGYYGDTNATFPRVGDVYYGHIVIAGLGRPCAGPMVHLEVWPPPASDVVNSPDFPIRCFFTPPDGQTHEMLDGTCPTASSLTIGPYGGYNFDSRPAGTWPGGPVPLRQGAFLEIWFPLISTRPMSGIATNSYLYGMTQAYAGNSPTALGKQGVFVAPGATPTCPAQVKGDFNADGQPDLLWRHAASHRYMVWGMNGTQATGAGWISPDPGANWQVVGSDDFNNDNKSDLVLFDPATGAVQFWMMNGSARLGSPVALSGAAPLALDWKIAATGDFNADGKPDLVWRNYATQKIMVWTLNGTTKTGQLVPSPDQAADPNWEIVAALDYNGDSKRDLLWYNWSSGKIVLWTLDQNLQRVGGQFTTPPNAGDANWKVLAGGDYSGSAATSCTNDIVWRNASSGRVVIWQMDNAATRVSGAFANPDGPTTDPDGNATARTDWILAGPR
jgi:hypothetical protein